jgi:hypothetical protein
MALQFSNTQWPFAYGLQEGVDNRQVPPGTLITAENLVWRKHGRLEKRFGITPFTDAVLGASALSNPRRVWARGDELCCLDDNGLNAYSATSKVWRNAGKVSALMLTWSTLLDTASGVQAWDTAVSAGGQRVDAWVTGGLGSTNGNIYYQIVDSVTGAILTTPTRINGGSVGNGVRVLAVGTGIVIVAQLGTANISAISITFSLGSPLIGALTTLRSDNTARSWDAVTVGSNFVIAYNSTSTVFSLYAYNATLAPQATGTMTETVGVRGVSLASDGTRIYVAYIQSAIASPAVKYAVFSTALAQTVAPVTIEVSGATTANRIGCCVYDATHALVVYDFPGPGGFTRMTSYLVGSTGTVTTSSKRGTYNVTPVSRPFMLNSVAYVAGVDSVTLGTDGSNTQIYECEITDSTSVSDSVPHRLTGMVDLLLGGVPNTSLTSPLPSASPLGASSVVLLMPFLSAVNGVYGNVAGVRQGLRVVTIGPASSDAQRPLSNNNESYLSGSLFTAYDGAQAFDYGYPRAPTLSLSASSAGGSIGAGDYLYGVYLESRSATGLVYRSPTNTTPAKVTLTGAASSVGLSVAAASSSLRQSIGTGFGVNALQTTLIAGYRTTANGTVYQRLTMEPTYNAAYISENTQAGGFSDTSLDASISGTNIPLASRPAIYTTGGILDDYAPPASVTQFLHVDRLWVLAGDRRAWWYSKAFQDDLGVAPGFNPGLRVVFSEAQTAGVGMDDKAIFFSPTSIAYMQGLGPAPNGQNSDFAPPTKIQTDVGCTNARSVVSTPDGIMFLSDRGIYLLSRGLEVSWIGRAVKDTLASYPNVTSAVLVPGQNQVRFTCNATDGATGIVITYDYVEKQWATWRVQVGGPFGVPSAPIADACMWRGQYIIASTGRVLFEDPTTYLDNGAWVTATLETAWISANGPLLFQSVRTVQFHGRSYTDHDLTISIGFDSETAYAETRVFVAGGPITTPGDFEDPEITVGPRRKCNHIRFKMTDATPSSGTVGTGRGPYFEMFGIEVGMKRGFGNTPAAKKA